MAAWLAAQAGVVVLDSWPARQTIPGASEEDTPRLRAARANAFVAAPGELRRYVTEAAGRRGAKVRSGPPQDAGIHYGCGGELPADERRQQVTVTCRACGHQVDQDRNMLEAMRDVAGSMRSAEPSGGR